MRCGTLPDAYFDILFGILSGILSGMFSGPVAHRVRGLRYGAPEARRMSRIRS